MNQILVTEKLYVTPELKRKKKVYKFYFVFSIFIVCILTSLYIYGAYDRNKSEETSTEMLEQFKKTVSLAENDTTVAQDDILMVVLNDNLEASESIVEETKTVETAETVDSEPSVADLNKKAEWKENKEGYKYKTIATVEIPKINLVYSVIQGKIGNLKETESLLKSSPVKYHGHEPNEVGNFCIVGHNYRNSKFFSKVPTLKVGDIVKLTDLTGRTLEYSAYDIHTVLPENNSDTTQLTGGRKELTLITCTDDGKQRVIVRCREV